MFVNTLEKSIAIQITNKFNSVLNSPSVKKFIGNVNNLKIGTTIIFNPVNIIRNKASENQSLFSSSVVIIESKVERQKYDNNKNAKLFNIS